MKTLLQKRHFQFALFASATLLLFHSSLKALVIFAYSSDLYFYILLVPIVSAYFIYSRRETAFSGIGNSYSAGTIALVFGCAIRLAGMHSVSRGTQDDFLCLMTASTLLVLVGGFIFFYGFKTFRSLAFPICFLFLMIPLPSALNEQIVIFLQRGSASVTYWLIKATGIPITRHGFDFSLSKMEFTVGPQCSGIRSGLYLFMTGLVFSQLYLKSQGRRIALVFSVLPIAIFKNGLRIVTIGLLGNYISQNIISSPLHRQGGIPFMIIGVVMVALVVVFFARKEKEATDNGLGGISS